MSSPVRIARGLGAAALLLLLFVGGRVAGQPVAGQPPVAQPAGRPANQVAIDAAIERGVSYLRGAQNPNGSWGAGTGPGSGKGWAIGYTALAGLALVECGVPTTDPGVKKAADAIRYYVKDLDSTYEVSLAILFLDRLGEKRDERAIQILAARLMAGQTSTGGWGYKVPKLSTVEHDSVLGALRKLTPPTVDDPPSLRARPAALGLCIKTSDDLIRRPPPAYDPEKARTAALSGLTPAMKKWPVFVPPAQLTLVDPADRRSDAHGATTDNSNTHFAMLAMWAARKHDVPAQRSLALIAQRFRTSQAGEGGWGYNYARGGGVPVTRSMTGVALIAMAIAHVVEPDPKLRPEQDPKVVNAFAWLSRRLGNPTGRTDNLPTPKEVGGLYYLWAVERVAVIFDVAKLGQKDWYLWGAEMLLCHQKPDGSWEDGGYHKDHPVLNTSFALLFLKRANLTPDLTRRLTVDTTELVANVNDSVKNGPMTPVEPVAPPTPEPPIDLSTLFAPADKQPETVDPQPKVPTTPPATPKTKKAPKPQPEVDSDDEPEDAAPPAGRSRSIWAWLLSALLAALGIGRGVHYYVKKAQVAEEKPKKKKKKPKLPG